MSTTSTRKQQPAVSCDRQGAGSGLETGRRTLLEKLTWVRQTFGPPIVAMVIAIGLVSGV